MLLDGPNGKYEALHFSSAFEFLLTGQTIPLCYYCSSVVLLRKCILLLQFNLDAFRSAKILRNCFLAFCINCRLESPSKR